VSVRLLIVLAAAVGAVLVPTYSLAAISGGPGRDTLTGTAGDDVLNGGSGDDELLGDAGADVLDGGAGADSLYGDDGNDALRGGSGNDDLDGGAGADDLRGGAGDDAVSYAASSSGVTVTIDNRGNDGASGEGDNVRTDVEDLYGSSGSDELSGDTASNTIDAGVGADIVVGGRGRDYLYGGDGADVIDAKDGYPDFLDCGSGFDAAVIDDFDTVTGCETVGATPRATAQVSYASRPAGRGGVALTSLRLAAIYPKGARIEVDCRGRGCPWTVRRYKPRGSQLDLTSAVADHVLARRTRLEFRITAPAHIGKYVVFAVLDGAVRPASRQQCLRPGRRGPVWCPEPAPPSDRVRPASPAFHRRRRPAP
jgi:hypothetical protein